jgi:hypothetical protein
VVATEGIAYAAGEEVVFRLTDTAPVAVDDGRPLAGERPAWSIGLILERDAGGKYVVQFLHDGFVYECSVDQAAIEGTA